MADLQLAPNDPELIMLQNNKKSGYTYRQRRDEDMRENYALYRGRIHINRLTQRQSVHVPLMKQSIRTLLKDVDDMPILAFENLDNDKQKEVFLNEYWKYTLEQNKMELKDIVDKKQVMLFGRSFDQMQIVDGEVKFTIIDPQDMLVDRFCDPTDIDTSRFLIHTHIFKPISYLESNPDYDQKKVAELKKWHATQMGLVKNADNEQMLVEKNKKLADLGLTDVENPILGETLIELTLHFIYRKEVGDDEEQLYMYVEADNFCILLKKRLEEVIGTTKDNFWRNHFPYNSWADDVERVDFWSDGVGDIIRPQNIILNTYYSQKTENRTLRSFGMNYYNSSMEGFQPETFNPVPWGWYPIPVPQGGNLNEVLQRVDIPSLDDSINDMNFIITMTEKATGATATQQGVQTERKVTLGEVQLALGEAKERVKGMSKFYTPAWKQRGIKFVKLLEAAPDKINAVKVFKKGRNTDNIYGREISPKDWQSESGYQVQVWSRDEKDEQNTKTIEKQNAIRQTMPDNPVVDRVYKRKLLEFGDYTPDEINEAMKYEESKRQQLNAMGNMGTVPANMTAPMKPQQLPIQQASMTQ